MMKFYKICDGGEYEWQPIMIGPPGCMPLGHNNKQADGQGRAGTAGGRCGDVSYDNKIL
jgi:hypothetical protein